MSDSVETLSAVENRVPVDAAERLVAAARECGVMRIVFAPEGALRNEFTVSGVESAIAACKRGSHPTLNFAFWVLDEEAAAG